MAGLVAWALLFQEWNDVLRKQNCESDGDSCGDRIYDERADIWFNVFIYIKLGMTTNEILKIAEEKFSEINWLLIGLFFEIIF